MEPEHQSVTTEMAPLGATATEWKRGKADAEADQPPDRTGSAAYWKGYIATCFGDNRHG